MCPVCSEPPDVDFCYYPTYFFSAANRAVGGMWLAELVTKTGIEPASYPG